MKVQRLRDAVTKTAKLLARDKVEIKQQGGIPHVSYRPDGSVAYVNLPMIPDEPSPEFMNAVQGFLDHEIAHVLFTDKKLEAAALAPALKEGLPLDRLANLSNFFEDVRIERFMKAEYKGSGYNLTQSLNFVLRETILPKLKETDKLKDKDARLGERVQLTMLAWVRSRGGDTNSDLWLKENSLEAEATTLDKIFPTIRARLAALKTSGDSAELAVDFYRAITPPAPPPEAEPEPEDGEGDFGDEKGEGEDGEQSDDGEGEDDESEDGEGAGGSEDESDSDTHKPDEDGDENDGDESDGDDDADADGDADGDDDGESGDEGEGADGKSSDDDESDDDAEDEQSEGKDDVSLTAAMQMLKPQQRKLITDYNKKKKSVAQIASESGRSEATVTSELLATRRRLNELLAGAR
jgi:cobaltochelatase CobT